MNTRNIYQGELVGLVMAGGVGLEVTQLLPAFQHEDSLDQRRRGDAVWEEENRLSFAPAKFVVTPVGPLAGGVQQVTGHWRQAKRGVWS